ncbi:MAG: hypothetical protein EOP11_04280 [Proteobacteria bacterium]|nr:MAG: hypothetical protein EOP11_04280 [Pseudomonadota bacterium]
MSISEQALFLLDIQPSISARKSLENFGNLDPEINESISPAEARPESQAAAASDGKEDAGTTPALDPSSILASVQTPFAVAARMGRPDYEEKAKAEALHQALRQMRAKHASKSSPRVIRGS